MRPLLASLVCALSLLAACTPYSVGTSARPLPRGERSEAATFIVVPGGFRSPGDSSSRSVPSLDAEFRLGLDDDSDIGLRINGGAGLIGTYKRRIDGGGDIDRRASAVLLGAGLVNGGQHAHVEATLITSGREDGMFMPYGGLRALQVFPLSSSAVSDTPTIGTFGGVRLGRLDGGVSFEVGVFYDRSALGLRDRDLVVVPSITVHGSDFLRLIGIGGRR